MSKKTVLILFLLVFIQFCLFNQVNADDLELSGSIDGYYYSDEDIYTQGTCVVEEEATVIIVTLNTIALNPGFSVELGSTFTAKIDDSDMDDDGLLDSWEWEYFWDFDEVPSGDPDDDGMPNGWEAQYELDPTEDDASGDLDSDDFTNLQEYDAGTDPTDPLSYPAPYSFEYDNSGNLTDMIKVE